ncbi:MAG TPA: prepilin-type N-terminal cleavage/methylation domain-containing protein [Candidatus Ozemobacteraceae bacterium]|nr:prepilin-type N-terminal cleavage/methylation domain-containing protein [Candidatus Ozemobacteraceae bacterium]
MPRSYQARRGVTLLELVIAAAIMTIMAGALYGVLSHFSYTRSIANARGTAKQEVELALRQIERDIAGARAGTFDDSTSNKIAMTTTQKIDTVAGESGFEELTVEYTWGSDGALKRKETKSGTSREKVLMQNLKTLEVGREAASGSVHLKLVAEVKPEGWPTALQIHSQDVLATIREEAAGAGSDTRWVRPRDLKNQF